MLQNGVADGSLTQSQWNGDEQIRMVADSKKYIDEDNL